MTSSSDPSVKKAAEQSADGRSELEQLRIENRRLSRRLERMTKEMVNLTNLHERALQWRDYSEREKQLQYEYNYLMLENAPDMLFMVDMELRFRLGTKVFLKLLRQPDPGTLYGVPIAEVFKSAMPSDWIETVKIRFEKALDEQQQAEYTDTIEIEGSPYIFRLFITPAVNSKGETMGIIGTMHDMTEIYRMKDNAEAAARAKSSFLASMSHEIRTPLNAVIGMAEIARRKIEEGNHQLTSNIEEILTASKHLLGILNDVLDFSKIDSGKLILASESFSLQEMLSSLESIIEQRCFEKNISLKFTINGDADIILLSDELHLKQVLINLLGNAVKFTDNNGKIGLQVDIIAISSSNVHLKFAISDTGIGISKEQQRNLFSAFEQADNTIAKRFGGTGLGLAISQRIINQMGGNISVSSQLGVGSCFWFSLELPIVKNIELPKESSSEFAPIPDLSGKRILLVEDIAINRIIINELLRDTHAEIIEAETGFKAIDLFSNSAGKKFDLIFMDIQMPGVDGYETTRRIRALSNGDSKSIPIIAMTANAYQEDIVRALEAGMTAHLAKPVEPNQLMEILSKHLLETNIQR